MLKSNHKPKQTYTYYTHYTAHHWTRINPGQAKQAQNVTRQEGHTHKRKKPPPAWPTTTGSCIKYTEGRKPATNQPRVHNNPRNTESWTTGDTSKITAQLASSRTTGHRFPNTKDASISKSVEFISCNMLIQTRTYWCPKKRNPTPPKTIQAIQHGLEQQRHS